ncbi:hypothetical protein [Flavivirga eckloniae]|uniref:Uncharacterized protein n=1 Tax=Flavivirga eckloniae TaxID=1803846 RepID=A0A2K9PUL7_9FLAO|nr:hypothetical protein [Flavivirga eckloniae]AUP80775.1 hypothetical protein C1H87_19470 [Flavivirga eckloniae]
MAKGKGFLNYCYSYKLNLLLPFKKGGGPDNIGIGGLQKIKKVKNKNTSFSRFLLKSEFILLLGLRGEWYYLNDRVKGKQHIERLLEIKPNLLFPLKREVVPITSGSEGYRKLRKLKIKTPLSSGFY